MAPRKPAPAYVLGVGMTKFIKPRGKVDYTELGFEAGIKAVRLLLQQMSWAEFEPDHILTTVVLGTAQMHACS